MFPIGNIQRRTYVTNERDTSRRNAQQETGETTEVICVVDRTARSVPVQGESIDRLVADDIKSRADRMVAACPTDCVAEGRKFLVHGPVCIATSVGNAGESAKDECDLSGTIDQA